MSRKTKLSFEERLKVEAAQEVLATRANTPPVNVLQDCLPYQLQFINDPSKRKAICSTRRSAKTYCACLYMVHAAVQSPNSKITYLTLTNESAKRIVWKTIIEPICLKHNITVELIDSKSEIRFANGSTIYLVGLDATPKQMNRLRGNAFDLGILDECQDFTQDLQEIYKGVLKMTLAQTGATLCMLGTPGNSMGKHYWWLLNQPDSQETEWKRFFFDWRHNTSVDPKSNRRVCDAIQEEVNRDLERKPLMIEDPAYRREIMGEWVIETDARIYRYEPKLNDIEEYLTPAFLKTATYALGFDLGYHPDPTSLVLGCWNTNYDGYLYILQAEEHHQMVTEDLAKRIKQLQEEYSLSYIVGDSANLNVISDLRRTYSIPTLKADKLGKLGHQNMLNSDFITNHIKLYRPKTTILATQLQTVIWSKQSLFLGKHTEDPKYDNHCTDALLYLHFFSRHHWYEAPKPKWNVNGLSHQDHYQQLTKSFIEHNQDHLYNIDFSEPNK